MEDFFAKLGEFVAYLGGASVILLGLSAWIGKLLSNRIVEGAKSQLQKEVESHKTSLRKSEFLFEKQYQAASEFIGMKQGLLPKHRFPEMEWDDACEDMARDFESTAGKLEAFIAKHGAVLEEATTDSITRCVGIAEEHKFGVGREEVSYEAIKAAGELWDTLTEVEKTLRQNVWQQSGSAGGQGNKD